MVEGSHTVERHSLADVGMIENEQIELGGEIADRTRFEAVQRLLAPTYILEALAARPFGRGSEQSMKAHTN